MRRPRIPGTLRELNKEVQRVMNNHELGHHDRAVIATGLIAAKVLVAYRIES